MTMNIPNLTLQDAAAIATILALAISIYVQWPVLKRRIRQSSDLWIALAIIPLGLFIISFLIFVCILPATLLALAKFLSNELWAIVTSYLPLIDRFAYWGVLIISLGFSIMLVPIIGGKFFSDDDGIDNKIIMTISSLASLFLLIYLLFFSSPSRFNWFQITQW